MTIREHLRSIKPVRVVYCLECRKLNRVQFRFRQGETFNCGNCNQTISLPSFWLTEPLALSFILGAAFAIFAYLSWPASMWLIVAFAGIIASSSIGRAILTSSYKKRSSGKQIVSSLFFKLREILFLVSAGIAIVCIAGILLNIFEPSATEISNLEDQLNFWRKSLTGYVSYKYIAPALICLLVLGLLMPRASFVGRFNVARTWISNALLILITITSFTFFSVQQAEIREDEKLQSIAEFAKLVFDLRDENQREIAATVWVEAAIKLLDEEKRAELTKIFNAEESDGPDSLYMWAKLFPHDQAATLARSIAQVAPRLSPNIAGPTGAQTVQAVIEKQIIAAKTARDLPDWRTMKAATRSAYFDVARLNSLRRTAIEIVSDGLADALGNKILDRQLLKTFVEELSSTLAKNSLANLSPKFETINGARNWVASNIFSRNPVEIRLAEPWTWQTRLTGTIPDFLPRSQRYHLQLRAPDKWWRQERLLRLLRLLRLRF